MNTARCAKIGNAALAFVALFFLAAQVHAAEVIRNFRSDIVVARDGELTVSETITVNVENQQINHGIFRDFPLTFEDETGRIREVGFSLNSVELDDQPEDYHTESIAGGIRIYAGSADRYVSRGVHTYRITYTTSRQIGYWDDHDELYWNVTGNGWMFPIEHAIAHVRLPDGANATDISFYTGPLGSKEQNARASQDGGRVVVETTRPLGPNEGLTFAISMPVGTIEAPSHGTEWYWWFMDNRNAIIGVVGALLVWGWYGWSWVKVGRDPPRGVMVPRWDAPEGISPALVNYIDQKGFGDGGWKAFSAAALNLAVKGRLKLEDLKNSIILTDIPDGGGWGRMSPGEAAIMQRVRSSGGKFVIDKSHGVSVKSAGSAFVSAIEKEHRGKYYQFNAGYIVLGVIFSILTLVALIAFGRFSDDAVFMLIFPNILAVVGGVFAAVLGRGLSSASLFVKVLTAVVLGVVAVVLIGVLGLLFIAVGGTLMSSGELPAVLALVSIVVANILFFFIMGAPTPLGSKMMDGIDGLRQYLTLAEKDRMNMRGAPKMSPKHFETLLPYAVALGVEKPWTETFDAWLAAAKMAETYQPTWYYGSDMGRFSRGIGGFSHSMASTIRSTLPPPPKSSSSGSSGGGFSGGGGGGGGGGGW